MAFGIMGVRFMFNKNKICVLSLTCLSVFLGVNTSFAGDVIVNPVKASNLPINVTTNSAAANPNAQGNTLVSPSKPQAVEANAQNIAVAQPQANKDVVAVPGNAVVPVTTQPAPATQPSNTEKNDFDFDLKMRAKNTSATTDVANNNDAKDKIIEGEELPKDIQYKTNPVDNLGNNILSQIDDDLFTQMSEIEKQMTLLTLELRREKIKTLKRSEKKSEKLKSPTSIAESITCLLSVIITERHLWPQVTSIAIPDSFASCVKRFIGAESKEATDMMRLALIRLPYPMSTNFMAFSLLVYSRF